MEGSGMSRLAAGRAIIDATGHSGNTRQRDMATALGAEVFGDGRLSRLTICSICGCLGDPGDDCGRSPVGHTLVDR